jgi:F0F1-type ATP synthase assembly protein I
MTMSELPETPRIPETPRVPDPPKATYQRPTRAEDPAERFLKKRGIGPDDTGNMGQAFGIGTALVGSIIAGTLLGWLLDHYVIHPKETPWGLIGGFFLGCVSGFANLMKLAGRLK